MAVDDSYSKSLLHFDGTDASTTFTDESGKTWTAAGNAQIDTAQSKFGGASGLFDGTGDYIDTPDSADFDVGSGDFTIDFWVRRAGTTDEFILGQCDASATTSTRSWYVDFVSNAPRSVVFTGTTAKVATSSTTISDTNWHHLAMVRNGNTLYIYVDGTNRGTVDVTGVTVNNSANKPAIGRFGESANYFNGHIDEFRFSKGIARWTANFTPPTSAYTPTSSNFFYFF